jgi:cytochrome c
LPLNAIFTPKPLEKPGFEIAVKEESHAAVLPAAAAVRADRETFADRLRREGRCRCQEVRRLPHLREGRPEPRRPELYCILGEKKGEGKGGFNFSPR